MEKVIRFLFLPIRILFIPISVLYGLFMALRNLLYDLHILPVYRARMPVLSVGNISLGGSGKTPMVMYLARRLQPEFSKIAVVSRGYGRKSKGLKIVSLPGKGMQLTAREAGDEPALIARSLPEVTVVVAEKRSQALEWLEHNHPVNLVIMDDGFQHKGVYRDIDLVVHHCKEPLLFNLPLPGGSLREFPFSLRRADLFIWTQCPEGRRRTRMLKATDQFRSHIRHTEIIDRRFRSIGRVEQLKGESVFAFAAIAHPRAFFEQLTACGIRLVGSKAFSDHYSFTAEDIHSLREQAIAAGATLLLCTGKDMVKLAEIPENSASQPIEILALQIEIVIEEEEELLKRLRSGLTKK